MAEYIPIVTRGERTIAMATYIIGGLVLACFVLAAVYSLKKAKQGKCVGCSASKTCSGGCFVDKQEDNNDTPLQH